MLIACGVAARAGGGEEPPAPAGPRNCSDLSGLWLINKYLLTEPSWDSVSHELRWLFSLHAYAFACLFFVLSFYAFFSFLNLRSLISPPPFMSTINIFLCLLGASRSGCLFIDAYSVKQVMPRVIGSIMWDIGFPLITSAFCLIQLAFLQLTQMKFGLAHKLQSRTYLGLLIGLNLACVVAGDASAELRVNYALRYGLQAIFNLWGLALYCGFLYSGHRVRLLLHATPSSLLARDCSSANQKGIMQLAMLAPSNNLASSVAAALVPTLFGPKFRAALEPSKDPDTNPGLNSTQRGSLRSSGPEPLSTVPEVYVRPPTPTPSLANLPIITVSSPSRRSSLASRRSSDVSGRNSRRASECSVRFVSEEEPASPNADAAGKRSPAAAPSPRGSPSLDRPEQGILRRNSDFAVSPTGSSRDVRRGSDFGPDKPGARSNQFANKLRRNSDFGNRTPRRAQEPEQSKLARILDVSPVGSRRNSDLGGLAAGPRAVESRRNSDVPCRSVERRGSSGRRASEVGVRPRSGEPLAEIKSESDSETCDSERAALVAGGGEQLDPAQPAGARKKSLSWKGDRRDEQEDITAETSLLPSQEPGRVTGADFTLHSILNHIAYVNRTKSDTPLHIPEASTAAARRAQIRRVLNVTYATAILGIILCIADVARIFGPYGLLADSAKIGTKPLATQLPKPWPWIVYQTVCRFLELIMGCAMASITKQPSASPRHQYLSNYPNYPLRMKQRDNLYI